MSTTIKKPLNEANRLLQNIKTLPIPVDAIVKTQGIQLVSYDLGEDISGVLIVDKNVATIGYNMNESRVRSRFTIAHELGHYSLHKGSQELFIDKPKVMYRKGSNINPQEREREREANEFAACLLMPESFVHRELESLGVDGIVDDSAIKALAKRFDVSTAAMTWRLYNLQLQAY